MPRGDDTQLSAAKRAYRNAAAEGNRQEEARWANVIGDILKNKGEYVEALKWLRTDYEVSVKYLPEKQLLPTCQSLGEVYLRLEYFKDALIYQKKHLELAKDSNDLIEQQRACTQLGRTYHEMFLRSDDDHYSVRNAKKYFKSAMKLAQSLKENPPSGKSSFLKEYIDGHNNIGMLEMDLDNLEEAQKVLTKGLGICDEEEVIENDDGRSRLHHNLGKVYMELRKWDKSREHIEKDIMICNRIGHCQGEAKGYINLGELHYRVQKCEDAILCYEKALKMAKSMEDEDALANQICQNIETVKEAMKVMDELKKEEQNLKKLIRNMPMARGTASERKCLRQQNTSLDRLIEKSSMIFAWLKHREFAKRKKRVAIELCDKEKLGDSFLVIGESYQRLRNFKKALKWYTKSWEAYKSIANLEGQALAKINIGDVLDSDGNWAGALNAFEEGYGIALKANLPSVQLSALENMHYSHMIRFDNVEEARRLQLLIDKLKQSKTREFETENLKQDCCSETETEGHDLSPNESESSDVSCFQEARTNSVKSQSHTRVEEPKDDIPLISLLHSRKSSTNPKTARVPDSSTEPTQALPKSMSRSTGSQETLGRKRIRVILSDDEGEMYDELECPRGRHHKVIEEDVATSDEFKNGNNLASPVCEFQDISAVASKCATSTCTPVNLEESTSSYKSRSLNVAAQDAKDVRTSSTGVAVKHFDFNTNGSKNYTGVTESLLHSHDASGLNPHACVNEYGQYVTFKIDEEFVRLELGSYMALGIECLKVEVACLYYLQLPKDKRSKGLLPIIQNMKCGGRALETFEGIDTLKDHLRGKGWIEVSVDGWVQKRLMKLYIDCCKELSETPSLKLLKKLYNVEISEDEVIVPDCELQDVSITPLLNALEAHKGVAVLDLSHNSLGNGTLEKLQQVFTSSGQSYGSLVLDLHCNRFGPTALFQICECRVLFARLEVLNISGNRLTDACGSYLSTILKNCKALYSLNIERCSITSRTIQKIADSLGSESVLSQICLGYNYPISSNAIVNLLAKLATLRRFSELNLNGLKLSKPMLDSVCQLSKTSCLSALMLGDTNIGIEGALKLIESLSNGTPELVKLDLSSCGLTPHYILRLTAEISLITGILELNLGGNPFMQEGGSALVSLLTNPQCCLRVLVLSKCHLGLLGVLRILQALPENFSLEELNLAYNVNLDKFNTLQYDSTVTECAKSMQTNQHMSDSSFKISLPEEVEGAQQGSFAPNSDQLEAADSEDDPNRMEPAVSGPSDSCASSCQRNFSGQGIQLVQDISTAIGMAKHLKLLDLSMNGFSVETAEMLYASWSSTSRAGLAQRHIHDKTFHLSVQGRKCCGVKPCCRRD
ncbi:protein TONSOKU isoform X1 [Actinidia eriantha]|uniref:protein TONSOKU isoform X1 n=2 Tax=Actinidia eriantha TaxID=165200 RepID=UPI00258E4AE6|nr:protein TONSOKU isoform X1 [Actinidia eriantha]